jgi:hypothetical protein
MAANKGVYGWSMKPSLVWLDGKQGNGYIATEVGKITTEQALLATSQLFLLEPEQITIPDDPISTLTHYIFQQENQRKALVKEIKKLKGAK